MAERIDLPREEVELLVKAAGLAPSPAQFDEILEAYGYVRAMTARLKSDFRYGSESAHVFVAHVFVADVFVARVLVPERT